MTQEQSLRLTLVKGKIELPVPDRARKMDFEREMQKALRVIFQNIQILEERRVQQIPAKFGDLPTSRGKRKEYRRTSLSLTDLRTVGNGGRGMYST